MYPQNLEQNLAHTCNHSTKEAEKGDHDYEASLDYIMREPVMGLGLN